jgi:hypothetical protein
VSQPGLVVSTKRSQRGLGGFPHERLALDWRTRRVALFQEGFESPTEVKPSADARGLALSEAMPKALRCAILPLADARGLATAALSCLPCLPCLPCSLPPFPLPLPCPLWVQFFIFNISFRGDFVKNAHIKVKIETELFLASSLLCLTHECFSD